MTTNKSVFLSSLRKAKVKKVTKEDQIRLVAAAKAGDASAREELGLRLSYVAVSMIRRWTNLDPDDVLSVSLGTIAETLDTAIENFDPEKANLPAFMFLACTNRLKNELYAAQRHKGLRELDAPLLADDSDSDTLGDMVPDPKARNQEHDLGVEEGRAYLKEKMEKLLTPKQLEVMVPLIFTDITQSELAAQMGTSRQVVEFRFKKAAARLAVVPRLKEFLKLHAQTRVSREDTHLSTTVKHRLTADDVRQIRTLAEDGVPKHVIARRIGASAETIRKIVKGISYKDVA